MREHAGLLGDLPKLRTSTVLLMLEAGEGRPPDHESVLRRSVAA